MNQLWALQFCVSARKAKAVEAVFEETAEEAAIEETAEYVANEETAEETVIVEDTEKASANDETIIEAAQSHANDNDKTITDTAVEVAVGALADELCPDTEFDAATPSDEWKSICTVDFYPIKYKLDRLEEFRAMIENYFINRKDVIKEVIKCEVVNYGNNVRLVSEMKMKRGWIFFFCDPEENYADLKGVRTVT